VSQRQNALDLPGTVEEDSVTNLNGAQVWSLQSGQQLQSERLPCTRSTKENQDSRAGLEAKI